MKALTQLIEATKALRDDIGSASFQRSPFGQTLRRDMDRALLNATALLARVKRMEDALRFYAHEGNYMADVVLDQGQRAQDALAEDSDD